MRRLRNVAADGLDEAARSRRASSRSSAAVGRIFRHLGASKVFERAAGWLRVDDQREQGGLAMSLRSFADEKTHFRIVPSGSPPGVDGFAIIEPKFLECTECGVRVRIDGPEGHTTTIDNLPHERDCPQRDVSRYFEERFVR